MFKHKIVFLFGMAISSHAEECSFNDFKNLNNENIEIFEMYNKTSNRRGIPNTLKYLKFTEKSYKDDLAVLDNLSLDLEKHKHYIIAAKELFIVYNITLKHLEKTCEGVNKKIMQKSINKAVETDKLLDTLANNIDTYSIDIKLLKKEKIKKY